MLTLLAIVIAMLVILPETLQSQWRRKTPRDTIQVQANSDAWKTSKMSLAYGFQIAATYTGTFSMYPGQSGQGGQGMDAKYTYYPIPGWSAPVPMLNPPSFNGRTDEIFLMMNTNSPDLKPGEPVKFIETTYKPSHTYTGLHSSLGVPLSYRVYASPKSRYGNGTGSLKIALAQWTAGISMRSQVVTFGNVNIGESRTMPDSIASYGIDPLLVDSVRIKGANNQPSPDFSFLSQRTAPFALANEAANEFLITYAPSSRGQVYAFLHIYCRNTDGSNREKVVQLSGYGVASSLAIGPPSIEFGSVRVGFPESRMVNIYNGGNGPLDITSATFTGDPVFSCTPVPTPTKPVRVQPGSTMQLPVSFAPTAQRKYRGVLTIKGIGVPQDSVILTGTGTSPLLVISDSLLNFGSVRRNDNVVKNFSIKNTGTYTANILWCDLGGPNQAAYSINPNTKKFALAPGEEKKFDVKFEPTTGPEGSRTAWVEIATDNGQPARKVLLIGYEVEPKMLLGRELVDFGYVKVGRTKWDTVSMYNNSNALLPLNMVSIKPAPQDAFDYDRATRPAALKPNAYDSLRLSFRPLERKQYGAWIHTNVNEQKDSVYMTGTGVLPIAVFTPPVLNFGVVPTDYPTNLFTALSDTGDYKMDVCSAVITGPDAAFFKLKPTNPALPAVIDPFAKSINFPVEFRTNAATGRTYTAWLKVIYCDGSADSVLLTAQEQAQLLQFGQRTVEFGKVRVKTTAQKPAVLSNGSNRPLSVGQLKIAANPPYFSTDATTATVDKKSQDSVVINFTPMAKGEWTGYLHASGADIKPDSILLKGTGAAPIPKFSDTVINFGTVISPLNKYENLIVDNIGDWWMKARVSIENDQYGEFTLTTSGLEFDSIGEGKRREYPIEFKPNTPQLLHTADLKFVLDDSSTYIVKLIGKDESQYLSIDSQRLFFDKVRVGTFKKANVQLVNTWPAQRTALEVSVTPATSVITATPTGTIDVNSRSMKPIEVTFTPSAIGTFAAKLIAKGGDVDGEDTVFISGIGAAPKFSLVDNLLDFGILVWGNNGSLTTTLQNEGNWPMHVTSARLAGPNQNDFTFDLASDTTMAEGGTRIFNVNFLASTPMQTTPRTAQIIFTLDDGEQHTLELVALDKAPLVTDIGFGEYYARPGDMIFAIMQMKTPIPSEISTREIEGSIDYDPTLIDLLTVEKFGSTLPTDWTLDTSAVRTPGKIDFKLTSATLDLRDPGPLMRIVFQAKKDLDQVYQSQLRLSLLNYLDTRELTAGLNDGTIIIDSSCGSPQILVGESAGGSSWIEQNRPNPFGVSIGSGQTEIHYDVAKNDAIVTIRVLDATGREVARPVDSKSHAVGMYKLTLDAAQFGAGTYIYELSVAGSKPMIRKMIVAD